MQSGSSCPSSLFCPGILLSAIQLCLAPLFSRRSLDLSFLQEAQCPGGQRQLLQASSSHSKVSPCFLATLVSGCWKMPLGEKIQQHFWPTRFLHLAATHAVLVSAMSKHVPGHNPRRQRHPSESLRRARCPIVPFTFSATPRVGWEMLASS